MFSKRDKREGGAPGLSAASSGVRGRGMFSVIGPDVVVTGNVSATADLHIDGRIEGDISCGTLAQGSESRILGNVTADTARIAGAIEGSVRVKQLTLERSARIAGDVEYENISIESGGHIDGRLRHMSAVEAAPPEGLRAVPDSPVATSGKAA